MSSETISEYHHRLNSIYSSVIIEYVIAKLELIIDQLVVDVPIAVDLSTKKRGEEVI